MTTTDTYWFMFIANNILLLHDENGYHIPCAPHPPLPLKNWTPRQPLPALRGKACMAYSISVPPADMNGLETIGLRQSWHLLDKDFYQMAAKAYELLYWDSNTRYCGVCGAPMKRHTDISKRCTNCGKEV